MMLIIPISWDVIQGKKTVFVLHLQKLCKFCKEAMQKSPIRID